MPAFLIQTLIFAGVLLAVDVLEHLARTQLAARPGWQRWVFVWGPVGLLIAAVVSLTDLGLDTILVTAVITGIVAAKITWHGLIRPRLKPSAPDSGD